MKSKKKKWNIKIAKNIAKKLNIQLNKKHWKIIFTIREIYKKYQINPTISMIIIFIKKKYQIELNSQDFFILFSSHAIQNATKISGLPKSNKCL